VQHCAFKIHQHSTAQISSIGIHEHELLFVACTTPTHGCVWATVQAGTWHPSAGHNPTLSRLCDRSSRAASLAALVRVPCTQHTNTQRSL
jgi:hypothetical protein